MTTVLAGTKREAVSCENCWRQMCKENPFIAHNRYDCNFAMTICLKCYDGKEIKPLCAGCNCTLENVFTLTNQQDFCDLSIIFCITANQVNNLCNFLANYTEKLFLFSLVC